MTETIEQLVASRLRDIPDFPEPGVSFKDFTPLLSDGAALRAVVQDIAARRAEDEAPGLDADDEVDAAGTSGRDVLDHGTQRRAVAEQRREVLERHPRLGEVGDVAEPARHQLLDRLSHIAAAA